MKKTDSNMSKKTIRLTESDLHRIVEESVKKIIREYINDHEELAFYNNYGNQSQYPAHDFLTPDDGELGMTAQYDDNEIKDAMSFDPEYFLNGKDPIYHSKKLGDYRTRLKEGSFSTFDKSYHSSGEINAMEKAFGGNVHLGREYLDNGVKVLSGNVIPDKQYQEYIFTGRDDAYLSDAVIEFPNGKKRVLHLKK